jgi:hypothetical protein
MRYDPRSGPEAAEWLAADDAERMLAVQAHHERAGIALPNTRAHAVFHVAVENQLAEGYESTVRTLARLTGEGADRHEAIHAIGSVLLQHMHEMLRGAAASFDDAAYSRDLDAIDIRAWRTSS